MKKYLIIPLLLFPSISLASPLTQEQASSLIQVVQSSPGTPASAFTDLITAFSNITVKQANSLITVVQSAPGVPAKSFVDLLIAFTEDQPTLILDPAAQKIVELDQKLGSIQNQLNTIQQNTTPTPSPLPPPEVDLSDIVVITKEGGKDVSTNLPVFNFQVSVLDKKGKNIPHALVQWTIPSDDFVISSNYPESLPTERETNAISKTQAEDWHTNFLYTPTTLGIKSLTFTSGSFSKTVTIEVK